MKSTFGVTEAQANLPKILRANHLVGISRNHKIVAFIIPRERYESLLESMELMANPKAMKALREYKAGKTKFISLEEAEKQWGPD